MVKGREICHQVKGQAMGIVLVNTDVCLQEKQNVVIVQFCNICTRESFSQEAKFSDSCLMWEIGIADSFNCSHAFTALKKSLVSQIALIGLLDFLPQHL